ncbi:alpha/beta hydrolase [Alloacidobacterium dinghuense]|uniref:Alpha/beta hydrolase n=1 Tax=Alloacidobacterium dinghuense TaxID=2763107 RepID=A0A7G8BCV4_9BACT|nr:alpha/beta hydrolase-fold protein [Alloacidobacterium dinghuense]QNI30374.1 alpha/beta hydrolase [Alloacidobacterium dinghuense]
MATEIPDISAAAQVPGAPTLPARVSLHPRFHSHFLRDDRDITVYVPPQYEEQPDRGFPVLYLHDGQNLFDPSTSFVPGRTWRVAETADAVIEAGEVTPLIIVGIANTGDHRLKEYTYVPDWKMGGGEADKYGRLVTEELMPFINANYRTLQGRENTGMGGSSLGALATLYLGLKYANVFSRLGVLSPSVWWNHKSIISYVNETRLAHLPRIWLDVGTAEGRRTLADADLLERRLRANGWRPDIDLQYLHVAGGTHDEASWAQRVGPMLNFLFPASERSR